MQNNVKITIYCIISTLLIFIFVWAINSYIATKRATLKKLTLQLKELDYYNKNCNTFLDEYNNIADMQEAGNRTFVLLFKDNADAYRRINQLLAKDKLDMVSNNQTVDSILSISGKTDCKNLVSFLSDLRNENIAVRVNDLNITALSEEKVSYKITLEYMTEKH